MECKTTTKYLGMGKKRKDECFEKFMNFSKDEVVRFLSFISSTTLPVGVTGDVVNNNP
jgi:hypothetical protein